jgi:acid phosphatase type 7
MAGTATTWSIAIALWTAAAAAGAGDPTIVAVGDIACDPADASYNGGAGTATNCRMGATANLVTAGDAAVLVLGDNQYENGALAKYQASYAQSWGVAAILGKTFPVPGNHEYLTNGAAGYYTYFGARAGDPAKGWYSYDLGGWHLIALNSNCAAIGGCGAGSPQERWLLADLAALPSPKPCILAYWHHPRFSSGQHGDDSTYDAFWRALYRYGADVALQGHDHLYERFHRQTPWATSTLDGIKQFTIGTGGKVLTAVATVRANSAARVASDFGVLRLTLHANSYDWEFVNTAGTVMDGSLTQMPPLTTQCHARTAPRAADYFTVPPCRLVDTRNANGLSGGPALAPGSSRSFPVAGLCEVPSSAVAVAVNVTAIGPSATGDLRLYGRSDVLPENNVVSFRAGQTRSSQAVIALGREGQVAARPTLPAGGSVHLVLDVSGYFVE